MRDIAGTLDMDELLQRVERQTAALLPCDAVATFYWDRRRGASRLISQHGIAQDLQSSAGALEFSPDSALTRALLSGETVISSVGDTAPLVPISLFADFRFSAFMAAPLAVRDRIRGALVAFAVRSFDETQAQLLEAIARQLAIAIEAAELYRAQQEESSVSSALAQFGREIIAGFNTPNLLDRFCRITCDALGCDCSQMFLFDADEKAWAPVACH